MRKTYKYRLMPNKTVEKKLHWVLARCRELYNAALSERRDAYHMAGKSITYYDQQNDLPESKAEIRQEYQQIAAHVLQDVLQRLNKAFQRFFDRVKQGQNPGYPRFQGRNRYASFTYPDEAGWKLKAEVDSKKAYLKLTRIGTIRVKLHRPIEGTVKTVTIKREGEHWYVCLSCEIEKGDPLPVSYEDVGIDPGVTHFAALLRGSGSAFFVQKKRASGSFFLAGKQLVALLEHLGSAQAQRHHDNDPQDEPGGIDWTCQQQWQRRQRHELEIDHNGK